MKHKTAIVTGVSRLKGIGYAICLELAKRGISICFTYWRAYDKQMSWSVEDQEPDLIQAAILEFGVKCEKIELDLSKVSAVEALYDYAEERMGAISILVNNATYSTMTNVEHFSVDELDQHYAVNIRATTLLTVEFVRRFKLEKGGRIVNLSSGQSLGPMSEEIAYAITKGAVDTLTYTLSPKIAEKGITINSVNPGPTDTGWMDEKLYADLLEQFPMKRIGLPADVAKMIGFLVSPEGEWITGQLIHSEGGFKR